MDAAIIACFEESCLVLGAMTKLLQQTRAWLQALCLAAEAAHADKDVDSHTIDTLHPVLDAIRECQICLLSCHSGTVLHLRLSSRQPWRAVVKSASSLYSCSTRRTANLWGVQRNRSRLQACKCRDMLSNCRQPHPRRAVCSRGPATTPLGPRAC